MVAVVLLGTCDTKLHELLELRTHLLTHGASSVLLIDVGHTPTSHEHITYPQDRVATQHPAAASTDIASLPRGDLITHMSTSAIALVTLLHSSNKLDAIISAGGSGGTALATGVMRALPLGFPKLMVSTIASGDTGPFVAETDLAMLYSVVDIAGPNRMLTEVLENAAAAVVGMARAYATRRDEETAGGSRRAASTRKAIGISMFGVTTPCVDKMRTLLAPPAAADAPELYVFHATGHGGRALERLVAQGALAGVIDLTTTEIADHVVGGVMDAGSERLAAALIAGVPCVLSVGACDMVNFGPMETVPEKFRGRNLYKHNQAVTLLRTSAEECRSVGEFIADKIRKYTKDAHKVKIVIPEGGVSILSVPGAAFEDLEADKSLFEALEQGVKGTGVEVLRRKEAINDESFAAFIVETYNRLDFSPG